MKPVSIKFTNEKGEVTKEFSTCSLKTGLMDNMFDILEEAKKLEKGELGVPEMRKFFSDLNAIIVEVFNGQFTLDELKKNVEQNEIVSVFQEICKHLMGSMVTKAKK